MDILNSEGTIMSIERIRNGLFLKIKKHSQNQYVYFPITRDQLARYFAGEITTREMLIPLDDLSFIDEHYNNIAIGIKTNHADTILNNL
jgi:hypothetical protein